MYLDVEGYATNNASCSKAVQAFVTGWVNELRGAGWVSRRLRQRGVDDPRHRDARRRDPRCGWIANWNGVEGVFGDPHVSDALWADHQRVHQYKGGHNETWGGVKLNIDNDYVDGPVVGPTALPPPPPPPTADGAHGRRGRLR